MTSGLKFHIVMVVSSTTSSVSCMAFQNYTDLNSDLENHMERYCPLEGPQADGVVECHFLF